MGDWPHRRGGRAPSPTAALSAPYAGTGKEVAGVWENRPNGPFGSAIHAYGTYSGPPFKSNNHGTRITKAVFDFLIRVRNR